jgi:hypothetical protein
VSCSHPSFTARVDVHRMFAEELDIDPLLVAPDSIAVDLAIECTSCHAPVRFEGPIGVRLGPGARPTVSVDGSELRCTGHLGENRTPTRSLLLVSESHAPDQPQDGATS